MIATRFRQRAAASALLAVALGIAAPAVALARDEPKDEALDSILEKIDAKPAEAPRDKPAPKAEAKPADKPVGELAPKDEAIDSLLEKLGEAKEEPAPNGAKPKPGGDEPPKPGDAPKPDELKGQDKPIDERLEELTGRRKKKKGHDQDENSGALAETIKQMREVEKRLGEPDTGEETRKKQAEIVKKLDSVLEQLRAIEMKPGKGKPKPGDKPGKQPGSKPGDSQGSMAGNTPGLGQPGNAKPKPPGDKKTLSPTEKHAWANLPPADQIEKDNAFQERALPAKESLIDRYYLSVAKKAASRGE